MDDRRIILKHPVLPLLFTVMATFPAAALRAANGAEAPEFLPTCPAPQLAAPEVLLSATVGSRPGIAWNGADYGVLYSDFGDIKFRRYFADGTPAAAAVMVNAFGTGPVQLIWTGAGYAAAWTRNSITPSQIAFALLSPAGTVTAGPTVTSYSNSAHEVSLAWNGSQYFAAFTYDFAATDLDVQGIIYNAAGAVVSNFTIDASGAFQHSPTVAWFPGDSHWGVVYESDFPGPNNLIQLRIFNPGGTPYSGPTPIGSGLSNSYYPSLTASPVGYGLAWLLGGNLVFARLDGYGSIINYLSVTGGTGVPSEPQIIWTGTEFAVVWPHRPVGEGVSSLFLQRISGGGTLLGPSARLSYVSDLNLAAAAWGGRGFLAGGGRIGNSPYYLMPGACAADTTPPACSGNYLAFGITGSTASISWSPSGDGESDLAYYQVYRDNNPIAKVSSPVFNDSGLSLSTTYNYFVQPVNALQLQNFGCTASLYVRSNASLTLTLAKASPDASLMWTDAGFNTYNVFRGSSPQVMSQVGTTPALSTQDPNALANTQSYFYSVDNPGP
jgi:hypothetical protein